MIVQFSKIREIIQLRDAKAIQEFLWISETKSNISGVGQSILFYFKGPLTPSVCICVDAREYSLAINGDWVLCPF